MKKSLLLLGLVVGFNSAQSMPNPFYKYQMQAQKEVLATPEGTKLDAAVQEAQQEVDKAQNAYMNAYNGAMEQQRDTKVMNEARDRLNKLAVQLSETTGLNTARQKLQKASQAYYKVVNTYMEKIMPKATKQTIPMIPSVGTSLPRIVVSPNVISN